MSSRFAAMSGKQVRHLDDGAVENVEEELRRDADGEHQQRHGNDDEFLATEEIGKRATVFRERTAKEHLHGAQKSDGSEEQAQDSNRRRNHREAERAFENQELADETIQARET